MAFRPDIYQRFLLHGKVICIPLVHRYAYYYFLCPDLYFCRICFTGASYGAYVNLIEDPALKKGTKKILFLLKYDNKEYADNDDTYACVGGYQGIYDINKEGSVSNSLKCEDLSLDAAGMFRNFARGKSRKKFVNKILNINWF